MSGDPHAGDQGRSGTDAGGAECDGSRAAPCLVGGWKRNCGVEPGQSARASTAASWRRCVDHDDDDGAAMEWMGAIDVDGVVVVVVGGSGGGWRSRTYSTADWERGVASRSRGWRSPD